MAKGQRKPFGDRVLLRQLARDATPEVFERLMILIRSSSNEAAVASACKIVFDRGWGVAQPAEDEVFDEPIDTTVEDTAKTIRERFGESQVYAVMPPNGITH